MATNWFCILLGMYLSYTVSTLVYTASGMTKDKFIKYLLFGVVLTILVLFILGGVISIYDL